jgi:hypothetical protein
MLLGSKILIREGQENASQISWFDLRWLDEIKDPQETKLPFRTHPIELTGTISNTMTSRDGYILCRTNYHDGSSTHFRVKLGEFNQEVPDLSGICQDHKLLYFYKGAYLITLKENPEDMHLNRKIDGCVKPKAHLIRINQDLKTETLDTIEMQTMLDFGFLRATRKHQTNSKPAKGFGKIEFFEKANTTFMFLFNINNQPQFKLWRMRKDLRFDLVSNFDKDAKQITKNLMKTQLRILDLTGILQTNSIMYPLSLLMVIMEPEDLHNAQKGFCTGPTQGGIKLKCVRIDIKLR